MIDLTDLDFSASQIGILDAHDSTFEGIVGHDRTHVRDSRLYVAGSIASIRFQ